MLSTRDESSGLSWETWTGWVTIYHKDGDGFWVEPDMGRGSPLGLTYAGAVAWVRANYPASKPVPVGVAS